MSIMGLAVLAVIILFALHGGRQGLVRQLSGVLAVVIAAVLVNFMLPYVTQAIRERTPVYQLIVNQCEKAVGSQLAKSISDEAAEAVSSEQLSRDQIRAYMDQYGLQGSRIDAMSDEQLSEYVNGPLKEYIEQTLGLEFSGGFSATGAVVSNALDSLTKIEQTKLIRDLPVPGFLQKMMVNYNNSEGYKRLGVKDFAGYLIHFIANILLNILSFIVTMLVTWAVARIILLSARLFSGLPLVHAADRVGGMLLGALKGIFVVWIFFLLLSILSGTQIGMKLLDMVYSSALLRPIYESNAFMRIVSNAMKNIM